jgi:prepilin-type N-terminal cleavage/methylation domain-containing protein
MKPRNGFTLIEVSVAGVLLALLMAVSVQMLSWVASERRAADRRQWAAQEAANVMERLTAQPWERLTAEHAAAIELSAATRDLLPEAKLGVNVIDETDQPAAKRLVVAVRWQPRQGQSTTQVLLTSWVYRHGRANQ